MGSGKTTLGKALEEKIRQKIKKAYPIQVTFASTIYEMHDACLAILKAYGVERDIKKDGTLLQLLGTEWGRNTLGEDIWVNLLKGKMKATVQGIDSDLEPYFIITDCRMKNEFDAFPGALHVRLECARDIRKKRCEQWRDRENHPSEIDLDSYVEKNKFDFVFNTGESTVEDCALVLIEELKDRAILHS